MSATIPFPEAQEGFDAKVPLRTDLNTQELMDHLSPEVRARSFFSARVVDAQILDEYQRAVRSILAGGGTYASQRLAIKQTLRRLDYQPAQGKEGTIEDLGSNQRIGLMLRMNVSMVRNYGQWRQMNRPGALKASPALELVRISPRMNPRWWARRWNSARADLGDATTATQAFGTAQSNRINAYALKNDPIWPAISRFGLPYPPFDYNSGEGLREVGYTEAVAVGVMDKDDDPLPPPALGLNTGLATSLQTISQGLADVLAGGMSDAVEIVDGELRFSNEAEALRDRCELVLDLLNDGNSEGARKGWEVRRQRMSDAEQIKTARAIIRHVLKRKSDVQDAMPVRTLGRVDFVYGRPGSTRKGIPEDGYGISHMDSQHRADLGSLPRTLLFGRVHPHDVSSSKRFVTHGSHLAILTNHRGRWSVTTHYKDVVKVRKIEGQARWGLPNTSQVSPENLTTGTTPCGLLNVAARKGCCQDHHVTALRDRGQAVLRALEEAACS